jgi:DNA-binding CsgD family transcriptional regulator
MNIDAIGKLRRGRDTYARRNWAEAFDVLLRVDEAAPLGVADLELLAMAAYFIGRDDDYLKTLERVHRAYLDAGDNVRAARTAFWLGLRLMFRGEIGPATGWLGRAKRLLESEPDCVEHGYMLLPLVQQHLMSGDWNAAFAAASQSADIGRQYGEADLVACSIHLQGRALVRQGKVADGLALLDEAMVAVSAGELSPLFTGLIYCSVIEGCQQIYALGRAREWTNALAQWCAGQPELVAFTGQCLIHRSEIMQLRGDWQDAADEAERASKRLLEGSDKKAAGAAFYQLAEVRRLRGEFAEAEEAYRNASQFGREPQPGLALLRMMQGQTEAATAAIRRVLSATTGPLHRARLLPAAVEILLAANELDEARAASRELEEIAGQFETEVLSATAAHARGAVELADGDARSAARSFQQARATWQALEAPYHLACVRLLAGQACRALGDNEGAALELEAARSTFEQLGAAPDSARIAALLKREAAIQPAGLTAREMQVLRLVASGRTNKSIAADLSLSEKTVDRHVSNIFNKIDVPSRAAATAYAYEHKLI